MIDFSFSSVSSASAQDNSVQSKVFENNGRDGAHANVRAPAAPCCSTKPIVPRTMAPTGGWGGMAAQQNGYEREFQISSFFAILLHQIIIISGVKNHENRF